MKIEQPTRYPNRMALELNDGTKGRSQRIAVVYSSQWQAWFAVCLKQVIEIIEAARVSGCHRYLLLQLPGVTCHSSSLALASQTEYNKRFHDCANVWSCEAYLSATEAQ